jgi:FtsH ternary system domain X1
MTAEDTALLVTRWAMSEMRGPLPEGDLTAAARLAGPGRDLLRSVGQLAAVTAARLRLAGPLLDDSRPAGLAAALVAAAIGGHGHGHGDRAALLMRATPLPSRAADLLAVHGLVAPAVARLPQIRDRLVDLSPLTGVLDRPGPKTSATCEGLLDRLRADPAAKAMVTLRFATPPDTPEQACWRGECLATLRHEDPGFVLDVFELAMLHFDREHEIRARAAWRLVLAGEDVTLAAPTASWWRALAEMEDATPRLVRERPHLAGQRATVRRAGTNLFRRVRELEAA